MWKMLDDSYSSRSVEHCKTVLYKVIMYVTYIMTLGHSEREDERRKPLREMLKEEKGKIKLDTVYAHTAVKGPAEDQLKTL